MVGEVRRIIFSNTEKFYEIQISVSLDHSPAHPFGYYLWLLGDTMVGLSSCDTDHLACKAESFDCLALYGKSLPLLN